MKARHFLSTIAVFLLTIITANAQQTYRGTMVTKLGKKETGLITVNLNGDNSDLIEIKTSSTSKSKAKGKKIKQTESSSLKLGVALISSIIINDTTYYFRDIKYDYHEKYHMNVCVRLIEGNLDCGIFQNGLSSGNENISVKLPNNEFSKLVAVDFDYYKATNGWHLMAFGKCASLSEKMSNKTGGYTWDDNTSTEDRIVMWKKWVDEYNECKKQ